MDILEIIKNRRSIRSFLKKEIPEEIVDKLIDALIWAPSAGNLQSRKFYLIFDQKKKEELVGATMNQSFIAQAPLVIVCCADEKSASKYGERGRITFSVCDVAAGVQNMTLLAYSEGLGTCWVGAFDEGQVSRVLNLPSELRPVIIVPVGYPAEKPKAPSRISKEEATAYIK
jgi:nitroreductase